MTGKLVTPIILLLWKLQDGLRALSTALERIEYRIADAVPDEE
ncbi:hypothetical protein ACFQHZ_18770 [Marivibrio halodurans]|nr:hypothetical protein [Marivibrio halodurans]